MNCRFITIEREYGSGGTKIAQSLAAECGIACYGREILEAVAKTHSLSVDRIQKYEETVTNSFLYTVTVLGRAEAGSADMVSREGHIFLAEQAEIRKLAAKGPAVFLGHCASEALKNRKDTINIFIRANKEEKKKRILADYGIPEAETEAVRKRTEKKRANYYFANTAKQWADLKNYDLVLDSSRLGIEGCVTVLKGLFADVPGL